MTSSPAPLPPNAVIATSPVRVADVGGWTDTWFGGPGQVCHLAVGPGITVHARWSRDRPPGSVFLGAPDVGARLEIRADPPRGWCVPDSGSHPLLEHAVASVLGDLCEPPTAGIAVEIRSAVPPGASLGTSASVVVALIAALRTLTGQIVDPARIAAEAHEVEVQRVGREAGIQDQWAAATGGASLLTIDPYPRGHAKPIALSARTIHALDTRLRTVVFGPHDSSAVHREVIRSIVRDGSPDPRALGCLRHLADLAVEAAAALVSGDLDDWARVLRASTDTQRLMHADLVGRHHQAAIEGARLRGATGWKVNGAGGRGGSLTALFPDEHAAAAYGTWAGSQGWIVPPLHLRRGVSVT